MGMTGVAVTVLVCDGTAEGMTGTGLAVAETGIGVSVTEAAGRGVSLGGAAG